VHGTFETIRRLIAYLHCLLLENGMANHKTDSTVLWGSSRTFWWYKMSKPEVVRSRTFVPGPLDFLERTARTVYRWWLAAMRRPARRQNTSGVGCPDARHINVTAPFSTTFLSIGTAVILGASTQHTHTIQSAV